jgi:hypothetical protein
MIPIYIYCTKEKPYLMKGVRKYLTLNANQIDAFTPHSLNGRIVARCEANEAFVIKFLGVNMSQGSAAYRIPPIGIGELLRRSRLSESQLFKYANQNDLFAIHLEHVTPCDLDLSEFYKDHFGFGTGPITKAPQSYCHAFRKIFISKEEYEQKHTFPDSYYVNDLKRGTYYRMEPCYIFADHSVCCADICNHFKDLEVRKTVPKELERICDQGRSGEDPGRNESQEGRRR